MKKRLSAFFLSVPPNLRPPLLCVLLWEALAYNGSRLLTAGMHHYDFTTAFDAATPFLPGTVSIYLGCYLFWLVNYVLACRQTEEQAWAFFTAEFLAKVVCLLCFVAFPTTNIRPDVGTANLWELLMGLVYRMDAPDNLFPSIHCLASWFSFIAVRENEAVPRWYRRSSLGFALLVCLSTLTTKQHVLLDVFGGVLLAEVSWQAVRKSRVYLLYRRCFEGRQAQ